MKYLGMFFAWFFSLFFGLLIVSMFMLNNWIQALVLLFAFFLCFPPLYALLQKAIARSIHPLLRLGLIIVSFIVFGKLLLGGEVNSIYKSPEIKAEFRSLYNEKMKSWPVPYRDLFIDSEYGKIHVIASGPAGAPPLLLLHASAVSSWSWKYNIAGLSKKYRCYAVDLIGDVGKSEFTDLKNVLKTGEDQAKLYAHISKKLGADRAFVAGASEGGFIATNYAFYYPERVRKLVLLGPMGYSGAIGSVIRIMFAQFFPLKSIQESTFSWAFSNNPVLRTEFSRWFPLVMTGYNPVKVSPLPFPASVRQQLRVPVLFVFGRKDNLVGDPETARRQVQDIPVVKVRIVDAGHLMAAEIPEEINGLMDEFFGE